MEKSAEVVIVGEVCQHSMYTRLEIVGTNLKCSALSVQKEFLKLPWRIEAF